MTRIVFLLVPGLHLLDLAGPAQAFRTAADLGRAYELHYVAEQEDVRSTAADLGCGYELHYVAEQEDVRTAQGATAPGRAGRAP